LNSLGAAVIEHFVPFCPAHCYTTVFTDVFIEQINDDDDDEDYERS